MFSLICVWINGWVNNREAGDLTRHRTHFDVIAVHYSDLYSIQIKCIYVILNTSYLVVYSISWFQMVDIYSMLSYRIWYHLGLVTCSWCYVNFNTITVTSCECHGVNATVIQQLVQANNNRNIEPSCDRPFVTGIYLWPLIPSRNASDEESVSMPWRCHDVPVIIIHYWAILWVRLSIFSQLSIIHYMGLCVFSLPISLMMTEKVYTLSYYHHQNRKYELLSIA